jgi:hypothetical protein
MVFGLLALTGCGEDEGEDEHYIANLIEGLYAEHDERNDVALRELVGLGSAAVAPIRASLARRTTSERFPLYVALARLGDSGLEALLAELDEDSEARGSAVVALREYKGVQWARVVWCLVPLLASDLDAEVRFLAAETLSGLSAPVLGGHGIHALIQALGDGSQRVRETCLQRLRGLGPAATQYLRREERAIKLALPLIRELMREQK